MEDERLVCVDLSRFRAKAGGSSPSRGLFERLSGDMDGMATLQLHVACRASLPAALAEPATLERPEARCRGQARRVPPFRLPSR